MSRKLPFTSRTGTLLSGREYIMLQSCGHLQWWSIGPGWGHENFICWEFSCTKKILDLPDAKGDNSKQEET